MALSFSDLLKKSDHGDLVTVGYPAKITRRKKQRAHCGLVVAFTSYGRSRKIRCQLEARSPIQTLLFSYPVQRLKCIFGEDTFCVAFFTLHFPDAVTI